MMLIDKHFLQIIYKYIPYLIRETSKEEDRSAIERGGQR